jgi:hypothetical protein
MELGQLVTVCPGDGLVEQRIRWRKLTTEQEIGPTRWEHRIGARRVSAEGNLQVYIVGRTIVEGSREQRVVLQLVLCEVQRIHEREEVIGLLKLLSKRNGGAEVLEAVGVTKEVTPVQVNTAGPEHTLVHADRK